MEKERGRPNLWPGAEDERMSCCAVLEDGNMEGREQEEDRGRDVVEGSINISPNDAQYAKNMSLFVSSSQHVQNMLRTMVPEALSDGSNEDMLRVTRCSIHVDLLQLVSQLHGYCVSFGLGFALHKSSPPATQVLTEPATEPWPVPGECAYKRVLEQGNHQHEYYRS
uniref:Uncharacterized protein n=1 Tax=Timema cristinae TaxID=61476 RepID=A0A7R9HBI6_TIMCR|nr:unnamed protein product [Timema cristinae]